MKIPLANKYCQKYLIDRKQQYFIYVQMKIEKKNLLLIIYLSLK